MEPKGVFPLNRKSAPKAQTEQPAASKAEIGGAPSVSGGEGSLESLILSRLEDDKAQDIVLIDLKGKSPVADSMVIASGRSHRHVGAIADHLLRALKDAGLGKAKVEGLPHCDWVLIDAGDVIVHVFRPEVRAFYNIEKIWSVEGPPRTAAS